jgi:hypothetical protein
MIAETEKDLTLGKDSRGYEFGSPYGDTVDRDLLITVHFGIRRAAFHSVFKTLLHFRRMVQIGAILRTRVLASPSGREAEALQLETQKPSCGTVVVYSTHCRIRIGPKNSQNGPKQERWEIMPLRTTLYRIR